MVDAVGDDDALETAFTAAGAKWFPALERDPDNFEKRVVRASLPVLHLAFALAQAARMLSTAIRRQRSAPLRDVIALPGGPSYLPYKGLLGDLLTCVELQDFLVQRAEALEALYPHMRVLKPKEVVQVRWQDGDPTTLPLLRVMPLRDDLVEPGVDGQTSITLPTDASSEQAAIVLLATLAAPPTTAGIEAWQATATAFQRVAWHRMCEANPDQAARLQPVAPSCLTVPLAAAERTVEKSLKAIGCCLRAAKALGPAVRALANGEPLAAPAGRPWSLADAVRACLAAERQVAVMRDGLAEAGGKPSQSKARAAQVNFEARVIRPARPVLHMAVALAFAWQAMQREAPSGPRDTSLESFDWWHFVGGEARYTLAALDLAEHLEDSVTQLPAGGPRAGELVSMRQAAP